MNLLNLASSLNPVYFERTDNGIYIGFIILVILINLIGFSSPLFKKKPPKHFMPISAIIATLVLAIALAGVFSADKKQYNSDVREWISETYGVTATPDEAEKLIYGNKGVVADSEGALTEVKMKKDKTKEYTLIKGTQNQELPRIDGKTSNEWQGNPKGESNSSKKADLIKKVKEDYGITLTNSAADTLLDGGFSVIEFNGETINISLKETATGDYILIKESKVREVLEKK